MTADLLTKPLPRTKVNHFAYSGSDQSIPVGQSRAPVRSWWNPLLDGKPASIVFVCVHEHRVYDSIGKLIIFYRFRSTSL